MSLVRRHRSTGDLIMDAASNSGSTGSQALAARSSAATLKELRVHYPPIFPMATQRSRRVVREKFRKRTSSWTKKGNELAQMTGAEIYWVIHHNNKYYTYKSTDRPGWPPSEQEIVSHSGSLQNTATDLRVRQITIPVLSSDVPKILRQ